VKKLLQNDYEALKKCPWCGHSSDDSEYEYTDDLKCNVVKCNHCGIIYAKNRLDKSGLDKYWEDYETRVHTSDKILTQQREKMYSIDFEFADMFISQINDRPLKILDIGCGNGHFLDFFERKGYICEGVEFGKEAAELAEQKHHIYYGEFDRMDFGDSLYNMIVFRGVLQYFPYPKTYLIKAADLLDKSDGYIFITLPNMDSLAARIFGKNFRLAVTGTDFIGYSEKIITEYMLSIGLRKVGERYFYPETPYADEEKDLMIMAKAVKYKQEGKIIDFKSPAFWGNMMTLMYKKQ
jgi:SAM-dependent methyltransferase